MKNNVRHVARPVGAGGTQTVSGLDANVTLGDVSSEVGTIMKNALVMPGATSGGRTTWRRPIFSRLDVRIRTAGILLCKSLPPST